MNNSQNKDDRSNELDFTSIGDVNPSCLAKTLRNVTNSYKHLLLLAILRLSRESEGGNQGVFIADENLATHMLMAAWWPGFHYRLNFGRQDRVMRLIEDATMNLDSLRRDPEAVEGALRHTVTDRIHELLRYVVHRLIRPWFEQETRGLEDHKVNKRVRILSRELFEERRPLYRIERNPDGLTLHPKWVEYISSHRSIISGWLNSRWLDFLERRNPNVPSLGAKISQPDMRRPLTDQRKLWDAVLSDNGQNFRCIYTDETLRNQPYELDHFVPWSFVSHDRIWNLTPVPPEINARKSDALPEVKFIEALAEQHARFAHFAAKNADTTVKRCWKRAVDDWSLDLHLEPVNLQNPDTLSDVYKNTHGALLSIAGRMGFPDWHPTMN